MPFIWLYFLKNYYLKNFCGRIEDPGLRIVNLYRKLGDRGSQTDFLDHEQVHNTGFFSGYIYLKTQGSWDKVIDHYLVETVHFFYLWNHLCLPCSKEDEVLVPELDGHIESVDEVEFMYEKASVEHVEDGVTYKV